MAQQAFEKAKKALDTIQETVEKKIEFVARMRRLWIEKVDQSIEKIKKEMSLWDRFRGRSPSDRTVAKELMRLKQFKKELEAANTESIYTAVAFGMLHGLNQPGASAEQREKCAADIQEYIKLQLSQEYASDSVAQTVARGIRGKLPFDSQKPVAESDIELISLENGDLVFSSRAQVDQRIVQDRLDHPELNERTFKGVSIEELLVGMALFDKSASKEDLKKQLKLRGWEFESSVIDGLHEAAN